MRFEHFVIELWTFRKRHAPKRTHPTAGAVPRAGPKEMFDRFAITRMYGECQLCIKALDAYFFVAFFLSWEGVMPKCSRTYLPKKEEVGKRSSVPICLMERSVEVR